MDELKALWQANAKRDVAALWKSITEMTDDPGVAAGLIAEAGQRDASAAVPDDVMQDIYDLAVSLDEYRKLAEEVNDRLRQSKGRR